MSKTLAGVVLLSSLLSVHPCIGAAAKATDQSNKATRAWLDLIDRAKYAQAWDAAAASFKAASSEASWEKKVKAIRDPLGGVKVRGLKSTTPAHSLPGAPAGDYLLLRFDTQFVNQPAAFEVVTLTLEKDGIWRVSGYDVKLPAKGGTPR